MPSSVSSFEALMLMCRDGILFPLSHFKSSFFIPDSESCNLMALRFRMISAVLGDGLNEVKTSWDTGSAAAAINSSSPTRV